MRKNSFLGMALFLAIFFMPSAQADFYNPFPAKNSRGYFRTMADDELTEDLLSLIIEYSHKGIMLLYLTDERVAGLNREIYYMSLVNLLGLLPKFVFSNSNSVDIKLLVWLKGRVYEIYVNLCPKARSFGDYLVYAEKELPREKSKNIMVWSGGLKAGVVYLLKNYRQLIGH